MIYEMQAIPVSLTRLKINIDSKSEQVRIINKVKRSAQGEALTQIKLFEKTVATWEEKPAFMYKVEEVGDNVRVQVWTDSKIYYFIDQGTKVRHAKMNSEFSPKTTPGWIGSGPGSGGVLYVSRKYIGPGIESRRFAETIYEMRRNIAITNLNRVITDEISAYWKKLWGS